MKQIATFLFFAILLGHFSTKSNGQAIPLELVMGHNYGAVDLAVSKKLAQDSRLGLFHLNMLQFYYNEPDKNSFMFMDQLSFETVKNLMILGGASYSPMGFMPNAGIQYVIGGKNFLVILYPGIFISSSPSFYGINSFQFSPAINENLKLLLLAELLNVFSADGNILSTQWLRAGIEIKGVQFGLAVNFDEYGPNPALESNIGLFVRKEIF